MSARMTFLALAILLGSAGAASAACGGAIDEFESIINRDVASGNLNKNVHKRIGADLSRARSDCIAGRDVQATTALAAIKKRYGYH